MSVEKLSLPFTKRQAVKNLRESRSQSRNHNEKALSHLPTHHEGGDTRQVYCCHEYVSTLVYSYTRLYNIGYENKKLMHKNTHFPHFNRNHSQKEGPIPQLPQEILPHKGPDCPAL